MDGVIIDSEGLWRQAQKAALAGWRAEVSDEECESLTKGKRLDEIARTSCEYCKLEADPEMIEADIRLRIIELIGREGKAIEGIYDVMSYFREAGYRIALATSSSHEIVHAVLKNSGWVTILRSFAAPTMNATENRTLPSISRRCEN